MKRSALFRIGCFATLSVTQWVVPAVAGVYIEMVDRDFAENKTELAQKVYIQDGNGRFVGADGSASIVKGDTMYMVDDAAKTYVVFDKATMEKLAVQINAAMEKMKEQLSKLPPEQRVQVEQMMKAQMPGLDGTEYVVEAVDTGKSDKVDSRACRIWDVKRNGELDEQLCVVAYSALPGKENLPAVFAKFAKLFEEMAKSVPMLTGMMTSEFNTMTKVGGFPVRTRPYESGKLGTTERLVKVWREEAVPASMFEIPAGYTQKQMGE
ncbi:MAG: DUF4412 domain-containing protein [Steroidobacteraceae bacterium]|nr:DUF4412 domain-containing protein [Steroidobacteraceae bacterium]